METIIFENLPNDIFLSIAAHIIILKDKLSIRQVNTNFRMAICFMKVKIARMNTKIQRALVTYSSLPLRWGNCINANCEHWPDCMWLNEYQKQIAKNVQTRTYNALCLTTFYYPKKLFGPHNYEKHSSGQNIEYIDREISWRTWRSIERYIPYCEECMMYYVNFGIRDDGLVVPYRSANGTNNL